MGTLRKLNPLAFRLASDAFDLFGPTLPASWITDEDYCISDLTLWLAAFGETNNERPLYGFDLIAKARLRAVRYYNQEFTHCDHTTLERAFYRYWLERMLLTVCRADNEAVMSSRLYYGLTSSLAFLPLN